LSERTVLLQKKEGVGILTLNRPQLYNAINNQLSRELLEKLTKVKEDR
jgi:2-(1,2-epoxy-1,2-dihydrophenyl)acetyl-CoA isomerase